MKLDCDPFEKRLEHMYGTPFHDPIIDVMDTFETVVIALKGYKVQFSAADAVALTEMILNRVPE